MTPWYWPIACMWNTSLSSSKSAKSLSALHQSNPVSILPRNSLIVSDSESAFWRRQKLHKMWQCLHKSGGSQNTIFATTHYSPSRETSPNLGPGISTVHPPFQLLFRHPPHIFWMHVFQLFQPLCPPITSPLHPLTLHPIPFMLSFPQQSNGQMPNACSPSLSFFLAT